MPQSKRTMVMKHMVAMDLILSLEADGKFPNVEFVKLHTAKKRDADIPPKDGNQKARSAFLQQRSERLQDLLSLVDVEVYEAYRAMLLDKAQNRLLSSKEAVGALVSISKVYQQVSDAVEASIWCNGPVHPSTYITREVVCALLA
jgi:hypothetical protein